MDVELPPPSRWVRMAGKGEDCSVPQWELSWGETVTVYTDGVEVGEHFHEDLPALRALALATLAAIDYAERQAERCPRRGTLRCRVRSSPALTGGMPEPTLMAGTPQLDFST